MCKLTERLFAKDADGFRLRLWTILAIALAVWGLTDVRNRGRVDPRDPLVHKTDFTCYTEAAAAFFDGRDPYSVTNVRGWGYPYPPLLALVVAPLAKLDPQWQVVVFFAMSVALCYGCFTEGRKLWHWAWQQHPASLARDQASDRFQRWLPWLVTLAVTLPTLNCLQRGQVGILKAYFLLLGIRWICTASNWRWALAGGIALALPVAVKVTPILPLTVIILGLAASALWRNKAAGAWPTACGATGGAVIGLLLFFVFVPATILGWNANAKYLQRWLGDIAMKANDHSGADRTGNTRTTRNQSLGNAVFRCGNFFAYQLGLGPDDRLADDGGTPPGTLPMDSALIEKPLLAVRVVLTLLLVAAVLAMARRDDRLGQVCVWGMAIAGTLIIAPIGRGHYFMLLLPAVVLVPIWFWQRGATRSAWASAGVPAVLTLLHYALLDVTGRIGLLGLGTTVWYIYIMVCLIAARPTAEVHQAADGDPSAIFLDRRAA